MTHQNQFGMFIHWGIYAQTGLQEQAIVRYEMERGEYEALREVDTTLHLKIYAGRITCRLQFFSPARPKGLHFSNV